MSANDEVDRRLWYWPEDYNTVLFSRDDAAIGIGLNPAQ